MKLASITVDHFRSLDRAEISQCGHFNVLIGKNNSGKSNLLIALAALFRFLQNKSIVHLKPSIATEGIDFHGRDSSKPIDVSVTFDIDLDERAATIADIIAAAPQMKHAVSDIPDPCALTLTVRFNGKPMPFAILQRLALTPRNSSVPSAEPIERLLFRASAAASQEISQVHAALAHKESDLAALKKISGDNAETMMRYKKDRIPLSYYLSNTLGSTMSPDSLRTIEAIVGAASNDEEVRSGLESLRVRLAEDCTALRKPLTNRIDTFAGEDSDIPQYVLNILGRLSKVRFLYLQERRKLIGKEEASRLLEAVSKP